MSKRIAEYLAEGENVLLEAEAVLTLRPWRTFYGGIAYLTQQRLFWLPRNRCLAAIDDVQRRS